MSLVTPDFTEVKDTVGVGTYRARIIDAKVDQWPAKDDKPAQPYINWTAKTFGEAEEKNNGRNVFFRTNTSGRGAFMLQSLYKAAIGSDLKGEFDTEQLYGKEIEITMTERNGFTEPKTFRAISNNR